MDTQVTLEGMEEREGRTCAVMKSVGAFKGSGGEQPVGPMGMSNASIEQGKLTGKSWFDPELGAVVESVSDQFMHLTGQMPGAAAPGGQAPIFTSDIAQRIQFKLVDFGKVAASKAARPHTGGERSRGAPEQLRSRFHSASEPNRQRHSGLLGPTPG